jgi:hypothetical protein
VRQERVPAETMTSAEAAEVLGVTTRQVQRAVVALDLAESLDPRQRAAGLRVLSELMDKL